MRAVLFAAADFAAADFAAAVFAAAVLPVAGFPAAVLADADAGEPTAPVRAAAARAAAAVVGFGDLAAAARAALFLAAAVRAAVVFRAGAPESAGSGESSTILVTGSMTTSPVGAAVSADAFAGFRGAAFVAGAFFEAGALFAAGARFVGVLAVGRPPELCFDAGALVGDAFWGGVWESSTWSVRSSGEGVTVLRYQWVARSQGCRETIRARIAQIPRTLCSFVYPEC